MTSPLGSIGIIGGSGMLGSAILAALRKNQSLRDVPIWISNRNGSPSILGDQDSVQTTRDNQKLTDACEAIILCVPPAKFPSINIHAPSKLLISVMAGVTVQDIKDTTGSQRIIRGMSSPAASETLAYSPWFASKAVSTKDRTVANLIFRSCGVADEIFDEALLDHFTAMTGPVPGFVAYFAQCMVDHAVHQGVPPEIADRAIRQLFLGTGTMLAKGDASPADHVREMIDYAGTTAAGLKAMKEFDIAKLIADGLMAAADKAKTIR